MNQLTMISTIAHTKYTGDPNTSKIITGIVMNTQKAITGIKNQYERRLNSLFRTVISVDNVLPHVFVVVSLPSAPVKYLL